MGERRWFDALGRARGLQIGGMEQIEEHTRLPPGTPAATAAAREFRIARQSPSGPWRGPGIRQFCVGYTATPCSKSVSTEIVGRGRSAASHQPWAYEERAAGERGRRFNGRAADVCRDPLLSGSDLWTLASLQMGAGRMRQAGGKSGPAGVRVGENVWDWSHDAP
jgi:hypothetical protein